MNIGVYIQVLAAALLAKNLTFNVTLHGVKQTVNLAVVPAPVVPPAGIKQTTVFGLALVLAGMTDAFAGMFKIGNTWFQVTTSPAVV